MKPEDLEKVLEKAGLGTLVSNRATMTQLNRGDGGRSHISTFGIS